MSNVVALQRKSTEVPELGSGPVWDLDAEAVVLCAVFHRPEIVDLVRSRLQIDDFACRPNWTIWAAMVELNDQQADITPSAVFRWIDDHGKLADIHLGEGRTRALEYMTRIVDDTPDYSRRIDPFLDRIIEKSRMRKAKWVAAQIHQGTMNYVGDVQVFIDRAVEAFREISDRQELLSMLHVSDVLAEKFNHWKLAKEGRTVNGISTGFKDLDAVTGGLRAETLTILAARPGAGKSALALNMATAVSQFGGGVAFFSLEMSRDELTDRILAAMSGTPLAQVSGRKDSASSNSATEDQNVDRAAIRLSERPLWIDDRGKVSLADIRARAKRVDNEIKRRKGDGLALIVVDYVGLMQEPEAARSREQAIATNSRGLKMLAKEMKIPVVLVCQMNREIEKRSGRPKLSDLRESGSLEQDADCVMFLHRDDPDAKDGPTELCVAKNRSGPCGNVWLYYHGHVTRFDQMHRDEWPKPQSKAARSTSRYGRTGGNDG